MLAGSALKSVPARQSQVAVKSHSVHTNGLIVTDSSSACEVAIRIVVRRITSAGRRVKLGDETPAIVAVRK